MTLIVRQVDLETELPALIDVFNRGFRMALPPQRFEWLYLRNPDGRATAWFVEDDRAGEIAGGTAVFPRRIQVRGQSAPTVAWNCGDFCIMPRYRLGAAAVKLRQAARDAVDTGASPFLYAHPNDRMLQIHLRVGHQPLGRMVRYARPTGTTSPSLLHRIVSIGLRAARIDRLQGFRDDVHLERQTLPAAIDTLFDRMRSRIGTALVRDVRYLTWRFLEYPLREFTFVIATRGSEVTGYLVFCLANEQLQVRDWLGVDERAVRTLFSAAIDQAFATGMASVSVTLLETHRDLELIKRLGFARRPETSTSITYAPERLGWRADVGSADAWYMTVGDRDV